MDLFRRKMLAATLGSLGTMFFNPFKAFGWGSFDGIANTHASIVGEAMNRIRNDPGFRVLGFPDTKQIMSYDWVSVTGNLHGAGTGPDVDGASRFSEHYYNPATGEGDGPKSVSKHYKNLVSNTIAHKSGPAAAKSAAWAAHFLSDMHVPYHMVGIPAWKAYQRGNANLGNLTIQESGPMFLYIASKVPDGWGYSQRFHTALYWFLRYHPPNSDGSIGTTDWYDPWYYNGIGNNKSSVVTGSHALWELNAHLLWSSGTYAQYMNTLLSRSWFDPKWKNPRINFVKNQDPWKPVLDAARTFATACATETRNNIEPYWQTPGFAICRAVRAVMTLFKAAVTTIKIESIQYRRKDAQNYKATCRIVNTNPVESLQNVTILFKWTHGNGRTHDNYVRLNQSVGPGERAGAWWAVPVKNGEKLKLTCAVTGEYETTPDLGYNSKTIAIHVDKYHQAPEPQPQPSPSPKPGTCPIPEKAEYKRGKNHDGYLKYIRGEKRYVGPRRLWYDSGKIKEIQCLGKWGQPDGIQTGFNEDGSLWYKTLFKDGKYIKKIK